MGWVKGGAENREGADVGVGIGVGPEEVIRGEGVDERGGGRGWGRSEVSVGGGGFGGSPCGERARVAGGKAKGPGGAVGKGAGGNGGLERPDDVVRMGDFADVGEVVLEAGAVAKEGEVAVASSTLW